MHPLLPTLRKGLDGLGLSLPPEQQEQLLAYMDLIGKWTKVYNLTAVRDANEMLTHHLLDSLAVIAPLRRELAKLPLADAVTVEPGSNGGLKVESQSAQTNKQTQFSLLDVGAGAGLPGIVIAITCPEISVTCVDTVAKKAAFIQQVAATLKLPNLKGLHARVESLTQPFDVVCSRAFASLVDFTTWSKSALASHGVWMAMKGKHPDQELAVLPESVKVFHVEQLQVPGLDAERCIIWMRG
ncbi:MAG: 16S rRNA (guanine(527)-N(7))-methyltransferase RsmG [Burkholderiales bacterium 35-55-47]|jgi:16S rRNA (guanine527-N7)-methyltransferase|uniref:16S rRNA (guanine(527)-N(7))-methyltransferase RsmG n=1 Tax=Limnohabitans sp. TaxID=1907725 RepID=UPI000BCD0991|nr:16S rRNA (guanine(527)-N(7))-methyltransferase RsmG [Limnohabitans sp.]OYY18379.1 MAG: 16S rRNA (guanine(527)-N(7))-methyltransferase RsmG [Burkholderiales bacterium 35-55-47]OYZ72792.1 MAG: 16S rRNA (guanine(527)-N(7))-methyltransferase RsmG [Burkholderiales bacterium 24-55-52]OZA99214.1 MAG: 16S rRNA (guanine(527)-N(7))-methyltransferase RsmG [Burkholderiales bacterium 39-55-53]HQR87166.1 16S rRNA (guanine(527)-N(7))-methyltransferase RsmG [Limnohabitans sp.]HQS27786.1 16S rRNA (guanine(5